MSDVERVRQGIQQGMAELAQAALGDVVSVVGALGTEALALAFRQLPLDQFTAGMSETTQRLCAAQPRVETAMGHFATSAVGTTNPDLTEASEAVQHCSSSTERALRTHALMLESAKRLIAAVQVAAAEAENLRTYHMALGSTCAEAAAEQVWAAECGQRYLADM